MKEQQIRIKNNEINSRKDNFYPFFPSQGFLSCVFTDVSQVPRMFPSAYMHSLYFHLLN